MRLGLQLGNQQAPHLIVVEAGHQGVDIFSRQVFRQSHRLGGLLPLVLAGLLHEHRVHGKGLGSEQQQADNGDEQGVFFHGSAPEKLNVII